MKINEVIIVEGRDDVINLKQYIDAEMIITHGFGIRSETIERIKLAAKNRGIIIFTDPDYAGEQIRKRINDEVPGAKHAFISKEDALKNDNIGVENAGEKAIINALKKVHRFEKTLKKEFNQSDLLKNALIGAKDSASRRNNVGKILGIGYANGKQFLNRLNGYGIKREDFEKALKEVEES
ncbi:MAG: ribonuclease M5 [Clostridiales bacterium]|nr:ribonuclease M5 [Clostridiales bacterium]